MIIKIIVYANNHIIFHFFFQPVWRVDLCSSKSRIFKTREKIKTLYRSFAYKKSQNKLQSQASQQHLIKKTFSFIIFD